MTPTIEYYNKNAADYSADTVGVDFSATQEKFLEYLPSNAKILDFGCGSGRDTKYFFGKGLAVDAIDGSEELCRLASAYTGISVKHMRFEQLDAVSVYDGIWACASILHLPWNDLATVLHKMAAALKAGGVIYTSFKYGDFSGERNGRFFTNLTENRLADLLASVPELQCGESWISADVRTNREGEKWMNVILSRKVAH